MLEGFKKLFGKPPSLEEKKEIEKGQASSIGRTFNEKDWFKEGENLASKPPEVVKDFTDEKDQEKRKAA